MKQFSNHLANESSPYLLQHAHNPVDWYPWGDEAFSKARREDKPIFLSVGYSTCHWCHVMERESFEDEAVGALLNRYFVPVKVDREERPDVDALAMGACQALTGGGGWPTTVLMTPDKKPFFAGTYFPRDSRGGMMGLMDLAAKAGELWQKDRSRVLQSGEAITDHLLKNVQTASEGIPDSAVHDALNWLTHSFDEEWGGFGSQPKFPTPHNLSFLLRCWKAEDNGHALIMVEKTLDAMMKGGIFDHLGYGFARYSTDRQWLIPHFEKMLYDNALLALVYCQAYGATGKGPYRNTAERIFTYVLRDMTDPDGGFYSAEDADSEGIEGKFYLWSYEELLGVLTAGEVALFSRYYPVTAQGNFEGANILSRIGAPELPGIDSSEGKELEAIRRKLMGIREKRIHPFKDNKILAGWNGLMIAALSTGGRVLDESRYTQAAGRAADFVLERMTDDGGRLRTRWREGQVSDHGFLDDYAYFIWGLLELFDATHDPDYLNRAVALSDIMIADFGDDSGGGFFLTGASGEELPFRSKDAYDGALPSGNAVAAMNLTRLSAVTGDPRWSDAARRTLEAFGGAVAASPASHTHMLSAFLTGRTPARQLVLAGKPGDPTLVQALSLLRRHYLPFATVLLWDGDPKLAALIPALAGYPWDGPPAAYLCRDHTCDRPTADIMAAARSLTDM